MNTAWFIKRIAESGYASQRELAEVLGMGAPALSRMLHGERDMTVSEAWELAQALSVPVEEIVRQAMRESRGKLPEGRPGWRRGRARD
ncbi:MAG TPA: helix-turn-helix transcriptional regulator [Bdellovibrionota bacterium]|nr:helix-turn-helix transcriptional regulator [Bdellovibrionota bacterium]